MSTVPLDPVIEGYLDYLADVRRQSAGTVRDVRCTLKRVSNAMGGLRGEAPLWELRLEDYIRWLEHERSRRRSGASLCKYVSHLRGLLDYAWRSGRSDRNVLDGFQLQDDSHRRLPQALSVEEARRLVVACPKTTPEERQERAIILVLYGCGLRTNELCLLDVPDVDRERRELHVHGKGDRQRVVPIPDGVFTELLAYVLERGGKRGPLFRTAVKRKRLGAHYVCGIVRRAAERAGLTTLLTPQGAAAFVRDTFDGQRRGPGGDRVADGAPQSDRDRRVPACAGRPGAAGGGAIDPGGRRISAMMWDYWICLYTETHCTARGLRSQTIKAYRAALEQFRAYVQVRLDNVLPSAITARQVLEYLEYLRKERHNGDTAVNRHVTILKNFYRAIVALGHLQPAENPLAHFPKIKAGARKLPVVLSEAEVERLLTTAACRHGTGVTRPGDSGVALRDRDPGVGMCRTG